MIPIFKNVGAKSMAKNFNPVSILSVVSKIFEKHLNNSLVYDLKKVVFCLISSMIFGLLDLLHIY